MTKSDISKIDLLEHINNEEKKNIMINDLLLKINETQDIFFSVVGKEYGIKHSTNIEDIMNNLSNHRNIRLGDIIRKPEFEWLSHWDRDYSDSNITLTKDGILFNTIFFKDNSNARKILIPLETIYMPTREIAYLTRLSIKMRKSWSNHVKGMFAHDQIEKNKIKIEELIAENKNLQKLADNKQYYIEHKKHEDDLREFYHNHFKV